jgi:hypothetical protein
MTHEDDFIGQLEGYLDEREGMTPLPDAVRNAVRGLLPKTRQTGPLGGLMRNLHMSSRIPAPARYVLGAALILVAAVIGASLLGRNVGAPTSPTPTPLPVATPGELPAAASLQAGRYYCVNNPLGFADSEFANGEISSCSQGGPSDYRTINFTVPEAWATVHGLIFKHLGEANEVALSFWVPRAIYTDPCHWQATRVETVYDLITMLQHQPGRNPSPLTTVQIFDVGYRTSRLELLVPPAIDIAICDGGEYRSWAETVPGLLDERANSHHSAGQVDVLYLVGADRGTLVIDASHMPAASQEDLSELDAILASIIID